MRSLITGGGFVGHWLARALVARGSDVFIAGLPRRPEEPPLPTGMQWIDTDVRSREAVDAAVATSRPDAVFHLAGISFPPEAERAPEKAHDVNVLGAARLLSSLERLRAEGADPVVLIVGSGVQYGAHPAVAMPLTEEAEQRPTSIYGVSKAAQEAIALESWRRTGLRVICTRSFNHSGVGHAPEYLLPSLVKRVRAIRSGGEPLRLGNDVVRDYLHVDDVVTAYLSLVERGRAGEAYNVSSGRGVSVRQLAADVLLRAGVSADISTTPELARASDIPILVGSSAKLERDTGWKPTKTHADIIDDLLNAEAD